MHKQYDEMKKKYEERLHVIDEGFISERNNIRETNLGEIHALETRRKELEKEYASRKIINS